MINPAQGKKCILCGKKFLKAKNISIERFFTRKYCSDECYYESRRVYKKCLYCHKIIRTNSHKYCSLNCSSNDRFGIKRAPKEFKCQNCHIIFPTKQSGRQRQKFCSLKCAGIYNSIRKRTGTYTPCEFCKKLVYIEPWKLKKHKIGWGRFCSRPCLYQWQRENNKNIGCGPKKIHCIKQCIFCKKNFSVTFSEKDKYTCSKECSEKKWSLCFGECVKCGTRAYPHRGRGYCSQCYKTTEWYRLSESKKCAKRRKAKEHSDITAGWLRWLWNTTNICAICGLPMQDHSQYPFGRHLDHITPLWSGGQHVTTNVRYIHAICNETRIENFPKKFLATF